VNRYSAAGWAFAGPALIMLGLFFFIPVLLAFALSLTDFDLYALADLQDL
jgi:multiple sugar transport system permease protein